VELSVQGLSEPEAYNVFTQVIIPRPIAWVLSDNGEELGGERWNLAPFSYFNGITSAPPMVMFSIGNGLAGRQKGTHRNLTARPEFVISLASSRQAKSVQETSAELPFQVSEVKKYDIPLADWSWSIPRVRDAPVSLGCVARQFTRVGATEQIVVFAEIDRIWASDDVGRLDGDGRLLVDVKAFDPLARVGKGAYARLTDTFRP
jgi:flavin reductase (DIM6/NTAB) family NADH-FMN oxidoreductase RutF